MIRRLSNPEARIKALEGRLQQYPSSAAFFPLASLLWEKGEVDQAENLLKGGLATYPNYAAAGVLLGEILISKDEHGQATRFISKALEIAPWNISGQRLLAECWRKKGDEEAAQVALRAAEMFGAEEVSAQSVITDSDVDSPPSVVPKRNRMQWLRRLSLNFIWLKAIWIRRGTFTSVFWSLNPLRLNGMRDWLLFESKYRGARMSMYPRDIPRWEKISI